MYQLTPMKVYMLDRLQDDPRCVARMERMLADVEIRKSRVPVIHNVDVRAHRDADEIRDLLVRQMWAPVRWTETIQWLAGQGAGRYAECGPGKVLAGLNRRISRELQTTALVTPDAISETISAWSSA